MIKHSLFIVFLALSVSSFCQTNSNNKKDTVREYTVVEEMPKFPGGDEAFYQWINQHVKLHQTDSACIPIKIFISFTVDSTGAILNPDVRTTSTFPVDCAISDEYPKTLAAEISKMPLWTPGKQNGKPVRVRFQLPVNIDWQ
jgi:hypothetical protein